MTTRLPILLYHSISDQASPSFRKWTVSPEQFAHQMQHLADEGYATLTAAQLAARLTTGDAVPVRTVLVTFDDGYADFATEAHPVMRDLGITATLFVTSGYVGRTSEWLVREGETQRPMLTWEGLARLVGDGVELGGHGYSHRQMDTLPLDEALEDIDRGRRAIERETGTIVTSFAYPHGYSTPALRRGLATLGFTSAHAVIDAVSSTADRPFALSRLIVDAGMTLGRFREVAAGIGVARHPVADTWRQTAWRRWRQGRLAVGLDRPHVPA